MIIATPLDLPRIEPDDWKVFWDMWNTYSGPLTKEYLNTGSSLPVTGAPAVWHGLDIFDNRSSQSAWIAPYFDATTLFPKMFEILNKFPRTHRIRLIEAKCNIPAHSDDNTNRWNVRALLHCTSTKSQWYFTKPNDRNGERTFLKMPEDTNWFSYNDKYCWHGSEYDAEHPKILLQIYSSFTPNVLIEKSKDKYNSYTVSLP